MVALDSKSMNKIITVKTGFGYYKDKNGKVVAKARLPLGEHPLADDFEYIEVAGEAALAMIQFDVTPIDPAEEQKRLTEALINQKSRELAITALKAEGKLAADYDD